MTGIDLKRSYNIPVQEKESLTATRSDSVEMKWKTIIT